MPSSITRYLDLVDEQREAIFPLPSIFARLFRDRPYKADIDDVYKRPGFPMKMGWTSRPKSRRSGR